METPLGYGKEVFRTDEGTYLFLYDRAMIALGGGLMDWALISLRKKKPLTSESQNQYYFIFRSHIVVF